jgi:hypothetical protein
MSLDTEGGVALLIARADVSGWSLKTGPLATSVIGQTAA